MAKYYGTNGNDILTQNNLSEVSIYGYGGNDTIYLNRTDSRGGFNFVDAGSGSDRVVNYYEGGNDIFLGTGNDLYVADIRAGDSKAYDIVSGGDGNDRFEVNSESSVYKGDAGNDTFVSVGYNNSFNGGSGVDTISYAMQDNYASQRGKGVDIDLGKGTAIIDNDQAEDLISIENAIGTNAADDITGSSVRNVIKGQGGADDIYGLGGNDSLYGGSGNDYLYGGAGADDITGGTGTDYLNGGSGADIFFFDSVSESRVGSGRDLIADFRPGEGDLIDLGTIDANSRSGGNQSFDYIGSHGFTQHAGELRFSNGILSGDVNGDGRADFEIRVNGVTKMYADDFIL
ncbi:hemolysin type calcium-binding protein [Rhizobium sp. PP-F2F-G48]|uniref:calcium-binding protein n=1 Tax=Rhizobium sp. PP-F2F-G48 TaxID=2135651 RepID=UPI00104CBC40|nr:calcium-binding protein [Rhizobium sp. PP-F2F-G48]TCM55751.1 hemolysin type calcium-binding protein [Rhizobium sp. PP-F2F-G48]